VTISLALSKWNLTPSRTPVITMTTVTAHVTPMITCFRVTRDFFPSPLSSDYYQINNHTDSVTKTTIRNNDINKAIVDVRFGSGTQFAAIYTMTNFPGEYVGNFEYLLHHGAQV